MTPPPQSPSLPSPPPSSLSTSSSPKPPRPKNDTKNKAITTSNDSSLVGSSCVNNNNNENDDLPSNVCRADQLRDLPEECLSLPSDDRYHPSRPLRHVDENGHVSHYALDPLFHSVILILLVELLERFSFYGINYTQTLFLTGAYNEDWNAGMEAISASSYVSISTAVAFTAPFIGAILADRYLGDYYSILFGSIGFYLPGLILIVCSSIPNLFRQEEFNRRALATGLLFLWPVGTGIVKSVVNIFGAKQYHPLLQSSLIESYYVKFYMCINIGALAGGILVPILAQWNVTVAYAIPVFMMMMAVFTFLLGTRNYVITHPNRDIHDNNDDANSKAQKLQQNNSSTNNPNFFWAICKISALVVPFNIAYAQMATTFILQGKIMEKAFKFVDAACMNNADATSVLFFGYIVGSHVYPFLAKHKIKIPTTYKFAFGSFLGALAILWALFVEHKIRRTYRETGQKVNILWQSLSYMLIGAGEIFAVSAAYEVAFSASPPEKKALASAVNLFCIGGLPNVLCIALYNVCKPWFRNKHGTTNISRIQDYTDADVHKYFLLLMIIATLGIVINVLPPVRQFVSRIEDVANDMYRTPTIRKSPRSKQEQRHKRMDSWNFSNEKDPENVPILLKMKRHETYLKYGSGPLLNKAGSMRAGPNMLKGNGSSSTSDSTSSNNSSSNADGRGRKPKALKRNIVPKLYGSTTTTTTTALSPFAKDGKHLMKPQQQQQQQQTSIYNDDGGDGDEKLKPIKIRSSSFV